METKRINGLISIAKENLQRDKSLTNVIFLEKRSGGLDIIALMWRNDFEKQKFVELLRQKFETGEYKSYLMINEAWFVSRKKEEFNPNTKGEYKKQKRRKMSEATKEKIRKAQIRLWKKRR